jgi:hypothetical protein
LNPSLARQIDRILNKPASEAELTNEAPLVVAARTLSHAADYEMRATTVVGALGRDDIEAFRSRVRTIADEYGLAATVTIKVGSFSVRFERYAPSDLSAGSD